MWCLVTIPFVRTSSRLLLVLLLSDVNTILINSCRYDEPETKDHANRRSFTCSMPAVANGNLIAGARRQMLRSRQNSLPVITTTSTNPPFTTFVTEFYTVDQTTDSGTITAQTATYTPTTFTFETTAASTPELPAANHITALPTPASSKNPTLSQQPSRRNNPGTNIVPVNNNFGVKPVVVRIDSRTHTTTHKTIGGVTTWANDLTPPPPVPQPPLSHRQPRIRPFNSHHDPRTTVSTVSNKPVKFKSFYTPAIATVAPFGTVSNDATATYYDVNQNNVFIGGRIAPDFSSHNAFEPNNFDGSVEETSNFLTTRNERDPRLLLTKPANVNYYYYPFIGIGCALIVLLLLVVVLLALIATSSTFSFASLFYHANHAHQPQDLQHVPTTIATTIPVGLSSRNSYSPSSVQNQNHNVTYAQFSVLSLVAERFMRLLRASRSKRGAANNDSCNNSDSNSENVDESEQQITLHKSSFRGTSPSRTVTAAHPHSRTPQPLPPTPPQPPVAKTAATSPPRLNILNRILQSRFAKDNPYKSTQAITTTTARQPAETENETMPRNLSPYLHHTQTGQPVGVHNALAAATLLGSASMYSASPCPAKFASCHNTSIFTTNTKPISSSRNIRQEQKFTTSTGGSKVWPPSQTEEPSVYAGEAKPMKLLHSGSSLLSNSLVRYGTGGWHHPHPPSKHGSSSLLHNSNSAHLQCASTSRTRPTTKTTTGISALEAATQQRAQRMLFGMSAPDMSNSRTLSQRHLYQHEDSLTLHSNNNNKHHHRHHHQNNEAQFLDDDENVYEHIRITTSRRTAQVDDATTGEEDNFSSNSATIDDDGKSNESSERENDSTFNHYSIAASTAAEKLSVATTIAKLNNNSSALPSTSQINIATTSRKQQRALAKPVEATEYARITLLRRADTQCSTATTAIVAGGVGTSDVGVSGLMSSTNDHLVRHEKSKNKNPRETAEKDTRKLKNNQKNARKRQPSGTHSYNSTL